ncbi:MAG: acyl-CoA dehydrogenase family protein [bacterium]
MNLNFTAEEEAFRLEVRSFIADNLPADMRSVAEKGQRFDKDHFVRWHKILYGRGWGAPAWPVEYGGAGWTPTQKYIFEDEMGMSGAPAPPTFGTGMVAPVIIAYGSEAQRERFLPPILRGDVWWCQGYSEPDSGSDLASLKTKAVREGDEYAVTGQKCWTTYAHWADWMFCLVRTREGGKPQEGISFLLIDMTSPGVTVRPVIINDLSHYVNDIFLEGVRVPAANLVGEEGMGWTYAKFLLGNERVGIARVGQTKRRVARLKEIAREEMSGGRPLIEDPLFRRRLAELEVRLMALECTAFRLLAEEHAGRPVGPAASLLKIKGSELAQAVTELTVESVGYYALPFVEDALHFGADQPPVGPDYATDAMPHFLYTRATTIYGGTNEIQRNILAKAVLEL